MGPRPTAATRFARLAMVLLVLVAAVATPRPGRAGAAATFVPGSPFGPAGVVAGTWDGQPTIAEVPAQVFNILVDGVPSLAFCIEVGTPIDPTRSYDETAWSEANVPNLANITAILQQYPPTPTTPLLDTMAVQAAIWHFSDGFTLLGAPGRTATFFEDLARRYAEVVAFARDNPVPAEPPPSIELEPPTATGVVGSALPFLLTTTATGPVRLSVASGPGRVVDCPSGNPLATVPGPATAHPICVAADVPGATTVAAAATATARAGRVFFHEGFQKIVLGADVVADVEDTATATHEPAAVQLAVDKAGPALSKVGDEATWSVTVSLGDAPGTPALQLVAASDTVAPEALLLARATVGGCGQLDPGEVCTFTYTATVPAGAPDPLVNEVVLTYAEVGGQQQHVASDDHETNLFQPGLSVAKDGPPAGHVGDEVAWTIQLTDTSSDDAPALALVSVVDDVLGDLLPAAAAAGCPSALATSGDCTFEVRHTLLATDPDPLRNTVVATANPVDFPNEVVGSDDHELDVHDAVLGVEKEVRDTAVVGEVVRWDVTVTNLSRPGSPPLVVASIIDVGVGWAGTGAVDPVPAPCALLAVGASCTLTLEHRVAASDPDPLVNRVEATAQPTDRPDLVVRADDEASTGVLAPRLVLAATGAALSKATDATPLRLGLANPATSGPDLVLQRVEAGPLGDVTTVVRDAGCGRLVAGAPSCEVDLLWVVPPGAADPSTIAVTATYGLDGTTATVVETATHVVELFQPDWDVDVTAPATAVAGSTIDHLVTITNRSSPDSPDLVLASLVDDVLGDLLDEATAAGCERTAAGESCSFTVPRALAPGTSGTLAGEATGIASPVGFPNRIPANALHAVRVTPPPEDPPVPPDDPPSEPPVAPTEDDVEPPASGIVVTKSGPEAAVVGDLVTWTFRLFNTSAPDAPDLLLTSLVDVGDGWPGLGDLTAAAVDAGCDRLPSGRSCDVEASATMTSDLPGVLANVVTVAAVPEGFDVPVLASDDHVLGVVEVLGAVEERPEPDVGGEAEAAPSPTVAPPQLPTTGPADLARLALAGLALASAGVAAVVTRRRR